MRVMVFTHDDARAVLDPMEAVIEQTEYLTRC